MVTTAEMKMNVSSVSCIHNTVKQNMWAGWVRSLCHSLMEWNNLEKSICSAYGNSSQDQEPWVFLEKLSLLESDSSHGGSMHHPLLHWA